MSKKLKSGKTFILFVLDESGSMSSCHDATISGFNEYLDTLKADRSNAEVEFSLTKFNTVFTSVCVSIPVSDVQYLSHDTYSPGGLTALYDAVAHTVKAIEGQIKKKDRALVVIMTDGMENSSKEHTRDGIFAMITKLEKQGNWTFTYLGANQDSWAVGAALGMASGNVSNYSTAQTAAAFSRMAAATSNYVSRAGGQSASFYSDTDTDG